MKNTTFRKKALLSSVAMLLVALVALGSATFAWFTQNKTVNANGLSLEASTSAGLQIMSESVEELKNDAWGTTTVLNAKWVDDTKKAFETDESAELNLPVSLNLDSATAAFYTTLAGSETAHDRADDGKGNLAAIEPVATAGAGYVEDIRLRSSIDTKEGVVVDNVTVSITPSASTEATFLRPAIRVTLIDVSNNSVVGTWGLSAPINQYLDADSVNDFDPDVHKKNFASGTPVTLNKTVMHSSATSYTMVVWLDGEDGECYTQNVENYKDLISSINVKFVAA